MPDIVPISRERHAGKNWRRAANHAFAATEAVVPLVGTELANAALAMPIAFTRQEGRHIAIGLLSLTPGRNLFVGPDGRWLGPYVPAAFRSYPFRLIRKEGTEEWVLCIDEDSKLLAAGAGGEPIFDAQGDLAPA